MDCTLFPNSTKNTLQRAYTHLARVLHAHRSCIDIVNRTFYDWSKCKYSWLWLIEWLPFHSKAEHRKKIKWNVAQIGNRDVSPWLSSFPFASFFAPFKYWQWTQISYNLFFLQMGWSDFCADLDGIKQTMFVQSNPELVLKSIFRVQFHQLFLFFGFSRCTWTYCENHLLPWLHMNPFVWHLISKLMLRKAKEFFQENVRATNGTEFNSLFQWNWQLHGKCNTSISILKKHVFSCIWVERKHKCQYRMKNETHFQDTGISN